MAYLIRPLPFLLFMGCSLALGLTHQGTAEALARAWPREPTDKIPFFSTVTHPRG
jgi:hypothetical protein